MKSKENLIGAWAILVGVVVAIVAGIFQNEVLPQYNQWVYLLLAILGIIIGLVSVSGSSKETTTFLLATVSLVIVSSLGKSSLILASDIGGLIGTILNSLVIMFIPATIIVALKSVFSVASFT